MNWNSIDNIRQQLDMIDSHLKNAVINESIIKRAAVAVDADAMQLSKAFSQERLFQYKSVVISMYGAFEQYVEGLLTDYITNLHRLIPNFSDLEGRIREEYVERWKAFHRKLRFPQYQSVNEKDVVKNLYEVICNDKNLILPECFKTNSGNYDYNVIRDTYIGAGIDLQPVEKYIKLPKDEDVARYETVCNILHDLVVRRNEIAHSAGDPLNILSVDKLQLYSNVIRSFAEALFLLVRDVFLQILWSKKESSSLVLDNTKALKKVEVLYFENVKNASIKLNQQVVVRMPLDNFPRYIPTIVKGISISEKAGDVSTFTPQLDATKTYHDISMHFDTSDVLKKNVRVLCL